jgi:23S rRNA pseudouridine1911/1915/1917 synthase
MIPTVLYEDNHCIAVLKPHGMLVQGDAGGDENLLDTVKQFIKERDQKPGNVFVGLLHRLDRPVGGVVLFAKTSKGASRLSEQFRNHTIEKTYLAKVEGNPKEPSGKVIQWLVKNEQMNTVKAFDHEVPGSKQAELSYTMITPGIIEIHPKTGRPHQIRVAMASLGCPIVGDKKYGAKAPFKGNIALFAQKIAFFQPVTKERILVSAPASF